MAEGYSGKPLTEKLGIRSGMDVAVLQAPANLDEVLGPLPADVEVATRLGDRRDLVLFFVTSRQALVERLPALIRTVAPAGMLWVAWPKRASKVETDLTEGVIREVALPTGLVDVKVCAVDAVWSGLKLVLRKELR